MDRSFTAAEDSAQADSPAGRPAIAVSATPAANWASIGIFLMLVLGAIAYARALLMPVVIAFLLALVFSPVRRFLALHGVRSGISAVLIVAGLVIALGAGLLMLSDPVTKWVADAPEIARELEAKLSNLRGSIQTVVEAEEQVQRITSGSGSDAVQEVTVREAGFFGALTAFAPAILAQVVFTMALLFFLLASGDMFYQKIVHAMPTFKDKKRAVQIAHDIEGKLSRYLFTITVINAGLGVSIGLAMWLIGMPNPLLFGVIGFAFNYIPYVGAVAGAVLTTVVGLVSIDPASAAFLAGGTYLVLTSLEGQFITPYFVGKRLKLNTVVVFLFIALWAWLWSVAGMLVAVPVLVAVRTFCEHIPRLRPLGDFLSESGAEREEGDAQQQA